METEDRVVQHQRKERIASRLTALLNLPKQSVGCQTDDAGEKALQTLGRAKYLMKAALETLVTVTKKQKIVDQEKLEKLEKEKEKEREQEQERGKKAHLDNVVGTIGGEKVGVENATMECQTDWGDVVLQDKSVPSTTDVVEEEDWVGNGGKDSLVHVVDDPEQHASNALVDEEKVIEKVESVAEERHEAVAAPDEFVGAALRRGFANKTTAVDGAMWGAMWSQRGGGWAFKPK